MATVTIDNIVLRNSHCKELAHYFRHTLAHLPTQAISSHLLGAIEAESIPPCVFSFWLTCRADAPALAAGIQFECSTSVRRSAIKEFGNRLRTPAFAEVWTELGRTQGILDLLASFSVDDVAHFCRAIGRSANVPTNRSARQKLISELLKALTSKYFLDSTYDNPEQRQLLSQYAHIVPSCSVDVVEAWLDNNELPINMRELFSAHPTLMQNRGLRALKWVSGMRSDPISQYELLFYRLPGIPADDACISESMRYSIDALHILTDSHIPAERLATLEKLILSLTRRLCRRRTPRRTCMGILEKILQCMKVHPDICGRLSLENSDTVLYIVRIWSKNPDVYQGILSSITTLLPKSDEGGQLSKIVALLASVRHKLRLQLLRLLLTNLSTFRIDIEKNDDLKKIETWPVQLLLLLLPEDARILLQRLCEVHLEHNFISHSSPAHPHEQSCILRMNRNKDYALLLLQLYLNREEPGNLEAGRVAVEEHKTAAAQHRDQNERALSAIFAIQCAVASGSQDLYHGVLLWARRFNRDALTVKALYGSQTISADESLELLCGIPERAHPSVEASEIAIRVKAGNAIILLLLETACMALREPSYQRNDWRSVFGVLSTIVSMRMKRCPILQAKLALTDSSIYDHILQDTLETIIKVESIGIQEDHQSLRCNWLLGPLALGPSVLSQESNLASPPTVRFLDEMARRRDELWQAHRRITYPATVALTQPWPRGLPIQALLPFNMQKLDGYVSHIPYLFSRAEATVFVDPAAALASPPGQQEEETQTAIGPFIDDYKFALKLFVYAHSQGENRRLATNRAWKHAFENLSGDRMSTLEALHFWRFVFEGVGITPPAVDLQMPKCADPIVPQVDDLSEPTEWNPDPDRDSRIALEARDLKPTCIDCMLDGPYAGSSTVRSEFHYNIARTTHVFQKAPWDEQFGATATPAIREGIIAAAILHIKSRDPTGTRILTHPFPSATDVRYPTLFLDEDFLDRKDLSQGFGIPILDTLLPHVPTSLILELSEGFLSALEASKGASNTLGKTTLTLLKILVISDKPYKALELVERVLLDRPNDSSWHRHIFNNGLLNRLSTRQVKGFLDSIGIAIEKRLLEQAQRSNGAKEVNGVAPAPFVKVTTVKMLSQVVSNAQFVNEEFATNFLIRLLKNSSHLDIQVATIGSLTSVLAQAKGERTKALIIAALEKTAVPIATAFDERHVLSDEDWNRAETSGELPDISQDHIGPVLETLISASVLAHEAVAQEIVERILLPIVRLSAKNNQRWIHLFLRKNGFPDLDLPKVPVKPKLLGSLLNQLYERLPSHMLQLWFEFTMVNLQPSDAIRHINDTVLGSPSLRHSNEGKHWLGLWNNIGLSALQPNIFQPINLLSTSFTSKIPNGVSYAQLHYIIMQHIEVMIMRGDDSLVDQNFIFNHFSPPFRRKEEEWQLWEEHKRPIIRKTIDIIEGKRTRKWQRNRHRNPQALKDTFPLKLWLLTWPSMPWMTDHRSKLESFASELSAELDSLVSSKRPYHHQFKEIKAMVLKAWPSDYCYLAYRLGSMNHVRQDEPTIADLLRIELADDLLRAGEEPKDLSHARAAAGMLAKWAVSKDEDIRMTGLQTLRYLKKYGAKKRPNSFESYGWFTHV